MSKKTLDWKKYERLGGRAKMLIIILNVEANKTSKKAILQANTHIGVLF